MSYVVLARKYRPRRFGEMVGQEHVVQALTNALTQQRLHHAYLFTGTRGIGKTTVSRILAKSLNCTGADGQGGITAEPCGVCQACTEIDADRYLDYTEMDAASHGGKDEIRELIERAAYKPGIGRFKVFMIDEAHQLTKDAFNALLKTLEEPPEYLKFVLATTDPEKMLPTVLSRCLQFNLRPMAPATVRAHLQQVLESESVPADDASLRLLARAARGSMRDALSLTDQAIAYGSGRLDEAVVRTMLGAVDRGHARAIVEACARRDGAVLLETVDALRAHGLSPSGTLDELALLLQQMAVEQAVPGALDSHDPETADARALAPLLGGDETQLLYSIVLHGRAELSLLGDEYAALSMVLLRFLAFPAQDAGAAQRVAAAREAAPASRSAALRAAAPAVASVDPSRVRGPAAAQRAGDTLNTAAAAVACPGSGPVTQPTTPPMSVPVTAPVSVRTQTPTPSRPDVETVGPTPGRKPADERPVSVAEPAAPRFAEPVAPPSQPGAAPPQGPTANPTANTTANTPHSALADRWDGLARQLAERGGIAALVRELAWQGGLVAIDAQQQPPVWRLQVERDTLQAPALRDKLAAAMEAELGAPLVLVVEPGVPTDSPARRDAAERRRRQAHAEAVVREDPVVRELLGQFKGARIVPGSIRPV